MSYLFLVNLGPVQEFIASARRSRDLWFGSWLLSELSKAAAQTIVARFGPSSLIFPSISNLDDLKPGSPLNIPNKILAQIDINSEELASFADRAKSDKSVEAAIYNRLHKIRDEAFNWGRLDAADWENAKQQIDDMLEYFWVAVPLERQEDYQNARNKLEALMAARKATRDFRPVVWGSDKPKSSLDGSRESVIPEGAYPTRKDNDEKRKRKIADLYKEYGASQAERLSGVDLLKRHGNRGDDSRFPSTSHIAALSLLQRLRSGDATQISHAKLAWDKYTAKLIRLGAELERVPERYGHHPVTGEYEGELLFESRLRELLESKGIEDDDYVRKAKQALLAFLNEAANKSSPLPYYAILLADGDSMGKAIDAQKRVEDHQSLSKALNEFARNVRSIVESDEHSGALVYAGGDDVLAFLPMHTVLDCTRALADAFKDKLKGFTDKVGNSPTLSVGVVVSHHLEPLSEVLALARASERNAKSVSGKNALAVTISKRSGADRTIRGTWGKLDKHLQELVQLYVAEDIPDGAAYQLRDMARRLSVAQGDSDYATLQDALRHEAIRILGRKQPGGMDEPIKKDILKKLEELIKSDEISVADLADELIVARDFAAAMTLASTSSKRN